MRSDDWRNLELTKADIMARELAEEAASLEINTVPIRSPNNFKLPEGYGTAWIGKSACLGIDPDNFVPDKDSSSSIDYDLATRVACGTCVVRADCLDYALTVLPSRTQGMWGGTSENERRKIRKLKASMKP